MKPLLLFAAFLLYMPAFSQSFSDKGTVFISGNTKNFKDTAFIYAVTDFFDDTGAAMLVDKKGNFKQTIAFRGKRQAIYLYLNDDVITFSLSDGDSLYLNWDDQQFKETFEIKSLNRQAAKLHHNAKFQIQWQAYLKLRKPYFAMRDSLRKNNKTFTLWQKYDLVNKCFQEEVKLLASSIAGPDNKIFNELYPDIYGRYLNVLFSLKLLDQYKLEVTETLLGREGLPVDKNALEILKNPGYKVIQEEWFWHSNEYRDFLYNYPRFEFIFSGHSNLTPGDFDPTLRNYYMAKAEIGVAAIRNWFIAKNIILDFKFYQYHKVESVYQLLMKELTDTSIMRVLEQAYVTAARLKPGSAAPAFTLKDDKGKNISLSDFNGKVVYLDFWGVDCAPCIDDIENYSAQLHEKYKGKEVAFVSVCVDADEKEFKAAVKKYKMEGQVNLIAEGWTEHPVCKLYNISGIPHYIVIDKQGIIMDNNAPRMGQLLYQKENVLDKALEK